MYITLKCINAAHDLKCSSRLNPPKYKPSVSSQLVSWCFEPSQPLGITSGLKTNSKSSLRYSAHKSFKTNNISIAQMKNFITTQCGRDHDV